MPDSEPLMERVMSVYRDVDTDHDGYLDKSELVKMLDQVGVKNESARRLFDAADHDGNGCVDFEEFCTWLFSDAKSVMEVSVKKGTVIDKHLKMELDTGDVLVYGLEEKKRGEGSLRMAYTYSISIEPTEATVQHLKVRAQLYAEEKKKKNIEALSKKETDANANLEKVKKKAETKKGKADPEGMAAALAEAEKNIVDAAAAKKEAEEKALEIEPVCMLEQVSECTEAAQDDAAGISGFHVWKFKANEAGCALVKVAQTCVRKEVMEVEEHTFTVTVAQLPEGASKKPEWFAWSWYDVKWVKAPANKADKFAKKMGRAAQELQWVPGTYGPKKEKLHVQSTYCFSPKTVAE
eukprot:TRINITY_DN22926_c0_g1_i1.p1 TRINITY_DN22926_c0_g1~~TRINITY_DN22926_c0_g1_i1.p1  ORF type:complete len:351 (+),score=100.15 TRINITY_DN22926_c0_g1_i1:43-1095(+)